MAWPQSIPCPPNVSWIGWRGFYVDCNTHFYPFRWTPSWHCVHGSDLDRMVPNQVVSSPPRGSTSCKQTSPQLERILQPYWVNSALLPPSSLCLSLFPHLIISDFAFPALHLNGFTTELFMSDHTCYLLTILHDTFKANTISNHIITCSTLQHVIKRDDIVIKSISSNVHCRWIRW